MLCPVGGLYITSVIRNWSSRFWIGGGLVEFDWPKLGGESDVWSGLPSLLRPVETSANCGS